MTSFFSRLSATSFLPLASSFLLILLLVGGCAVEPPSQTGTLTTPGAETQGKSEGDNVFSRMGETPAAWLPSQSAYPTPAQMAHQMQKKLVRPGVTKIAFLAPLSGPNEGLGSAMVNAAQLAVFDIGGEGFELMPRDTKGTPDGAVTATREALGSGAHLIIGPLFAAEVAAVKPVLAQSTISALPLSTDVSLAGPGMYVMGFAPTPQVKRVVSFALSRGLKRFVSLIPDGPYGELVAQAFEETVKNGGGTVVFSGSADASSHLGAYRGQFDAIFLPLAGETLSKAAAQLQGLGLGKVQLLGTGLWDVPHLGGTTPFLIGGWYAAAEPEPRMQFIKVYKDTYGQEPPRLATLAYDATALAAVLVRKGIGIDQTSLTSPSGFAGLDGIFRLTPEGFIERGLAINEITATGSKVIDHAPTSFVGY